jgi:hypothetical protein
MRKYKGGDCEKWPVYGHFVAKAEISQAKPIGLSAAA